MFTLNLFLAQFSLIIQANFTENTFLYFFYKYKYSINILVTFCQVVNFIKLYFTFSDLSALSDDSPSAFKEEQVLEYAAVCLALYLCICSYICVYVSVYLDESLSRKPVLLSPQSIASWLNDIGQDKTREPLTFAMIIVLWWGQLVMK